MKGPLAALALVSMLGSLSLAQEGAEVELTVTATRISEDVDVVPAAVTVVSGKELRDRGVRDLRGALALAGGVDVAPGGDAGPAGAIPEMYGLREVDAFLLVVDGVPWGGAFNPSVATVDFENVDRVEVIRGAAPVMYGATSFIGVIHVIHKDPKLVQRSAKVFAGDHDSRGYSVSVPVSGGKVDSVIEAGSKREGFRDPRTSFQRDHAAWRGTTNTRLGSLQFAAEGTALRQSPASPRLREGKELSDNNPVDANYNPGGATMDELRGSLRANLKHSLEHGTWSTTLSASAADQRTLRGFLVDITTSPNAHGFRQTTALSDFYFDSHVQLDPAGTLKVVAGADHLQGFDNSTGGDFDYDTDLAGIAPPTGSSLPSQARIRFHDYRAFSGVYGFAEWTPVPRLILEGGARLNRTEEFRRTSTLEFPSTFSEGTNRREELKPSGSAAATWKVWHSGGDLLSLYANYRDTFKPAAVDFGLDSGSRIFEPENAQSYEGGVKTRLLDGRLDMDVSAFQMDFDHVVVPNTSGTPGLESGGKIRVKGIDAEFSAGLARNLSWKGAYSLHDARFGNWMEDFGSGPRQLKGNRFEMSARNMASTGLIYAPADGWSTDVSGGYVGSRFLNKRNTALADAYMTWGAGLGYRSGGWELRLDGRNLSIVRPPVSESEMGDAQYYLLPVRRVDLTTSWRF